MGKELRYNISDWRQLINVKSNISTKLSIKVSDILNAPILTGLRIRVYHAEYGDLYTCVLGAEGSLVSEDPSVIDFEPSTDEILKTLSKYGFLVTYDQQRNLPYDQLEFLASLLGLEYDKLRLVTVWNISNGVKQFKTYVVVFKISENPTWINNGYSPSEKEFTESLRNGSVVNLSASSQTHKWNWSWLTFVANIEDILSENNYS